jgi:hypothetical protein
MAVLVTGRGGRPGPPERHPIPLASSTSDPLLADLDADGRLDVVLVADLRSLALFRALG